jgi:hypothetical protein
VSWCENNDFNHVLKLSHLGSDIFQPMHLAKYNMMSRAEQKNRERNEYGLVEPFLFTLKFAMIFPLNHHFPRCWSAQIVDGGHALACAGAF